MGASTARSTNRLAASQESDEDSKRRSTLPRDWFLEFRHLIGELMSLGTSSPDAPQKYRGRKLII
jgi:hypothetical protein